MTTDDLTPPGESTTEYQALQALIALLQGSHFWASILKVCGVVSFIGTLASGYIVQFASANPANHTFTAIAGLLSGLFLVSGAILRTSAIDTQARAVKNYSDNRTQLKSDALDVIQAQPAVTAKTV